MTTEPSIRVHLTNATQLKARRKVEREAGRLLRVPTMGKADATSPRSQRAVFLSYECRGQAFAGISGETRGIQETPRGTQGTPRRHPETQEAPSDHSGETQGQEDMINKLKSLYNGSQMFRQSLSTLQVSSRWF